MHRPLYESTEDRLIQLKIIKYLQSAIGIKVIELPNPKDIADGLMFDRESDKFLGWLEVKYRNTKFGAFPDYMLSFTKYLNMVQRAKFTKTQFLLVIGFERGEDIRFYAYKKDDEHKFKYNVQKSNFRGDKLDIETVVYIPLDRFERL